MQARCQTEVVEQKAVHTKHTCLTSGPAQGRQQPTQETEGHPRAVVVAGVVVVAFAMVVVVMAQVVAMVVEVPWMLAAYHQRDRQCLSAAKQATTLPTMPTMLTL